MRPRWLNVAPHRAHISNDFMNWCDQRSIEVVDSLGKAKEQQGKVEQHAQLFELTLEDVLADVQPLEGMLRRAARGQEQLVVCFWRLSDAAGIRSQSRYPGGFLGRHSESDREQFVSIRQSPWTSGECLDDRELRHDRVFTHPRLATPRQEQTRILVTSPIYPLRDRLKLFDATVIPSLLYGSRTWMTTEEMKNKLQTTRRRMMRVIIIDEKKFR